MPYSIDITGMSGGTVPVNYYICDINGNNCQLLGNTTGIYVAPAFFQNVDDFMVKGIDSNGCDLFQILNC